jgi:cation transport regulator ChaC
MILEDDPITAEIRVIRQKISANVGDNLQKLLEHYQKLEKEAIKSKKYHFVNLKLHKPVAIN